MQLSVRVKVVFGDADAARVAHVALRPDNVGLPEGLDMSMKREGRVLTVAFCSKRDVNTLASTVDEVLEKIQVSHEVMSRVKK